MRSTLQTLPFPISSASALNLSFSRTAPSRQLSSYHKRLRIHRTHAWSLQCRHSKINSYRRSRHSSQRCGPCTRRQPLVWSQSWHSRSSRAICWTRSPRGATITAAPGPASRFAISWARCRSMSSSYTTQVQFFHLRPHS